MRLLHPRRAVAQTKKAEMSRIETTVCHECEKQIVIPTVSPCGESDKLTGIWLSTMDENDNFESIGALCVECAFRLCDEGKISLGFAGGRLGNLENWEAILSRK